MTNEEEKPRGELLLQLVEKLLDINYQLHEITGERLNALEDQLETLGNKKRRE